MGWNEVKYINNEFNTKFQSPRYYFMHHIIVCDNNEDIYQLVNTVYLLVV